MRSKPVLPNLDRVPPSSGALSYASPRGEFDTSLTGCRSGEPAGGSRPPGNRDFIKLISAQLNNLILTRCLGENPARQNTRARQCHRADSSRWAGDV